MTGRAAPREVSPDRADQVSRDAFLESLFVMIGARPRTEWLPHDVQRDEDGFPVTGTESAASDH